MPFGSRPFGIGLFGAESPTVSSAPPVLKPPTATLFQLRTRTFTQNPDGTLKSIHAIDQIVALRASFPKGSVRTTPTMGHRFSTLNRLAPDQIQAAAERLVAELYADLIANGDIRIIRVMTATPARGNNQVVFEYVNLRISQKGKVSSG